LHHVLQQPHSYKEHTKDKQKRTNINRVVEPTPKDNKQSLRSQTPVDNPHAEVEIKPQLKPRGSVAKE